jgi:phage shock protein A
MNTVEKVAKQTIHDKLESQIKMAEAKLDMLKARALSAKADTEVKALTELLTRKRALEQEVNALKKMGEEKWEHAKTDLEARVAHFEKSVQEMEAKAKHG